MNKSCSCTTGMSVLARQGWTIAREPRSPRLPGDTAVTCAACGAVWRLRPSAARVAA